MFIPKWVFERLADRGPQQETQRLLSEAMRNVSDLHAQNATLRGQNVELEKRVISAETTLDWFRVRINQLEAERAILLSKQVGAPMFAAQVQPAAEGSGSGRPSIMDDLTFEDVGDERAAQLGLRESM